MNCLKASRPNVVALGGDDGGIDSASEKKHAKTNEVRSGRKIVAQRT